MKKYYTVLAACFFVFMLTACGKSGKGNSSEENNNTEDTTAKTPDTTKLDSVNTIDTTQTTEGDPSSALDSVKKFIVNEWKVKAVFAPGQDNNVMDEQQKEKMKKSSIVFKPDGTQSMNVELKKEKISEDGLWKLAEEGKQVIMTSPGGKERRFKIEEITRYTLKLRALIDQSGIVLEAKDAPSIGPLKK